MKVPRLRGILHTLRGLPSLMLGGCLACASAPASKVTPPERPAPPAPTRQPAPTSETAAARLARQKAECERDYGDMEPRTAVESQFDDARVLKELAARCGSHLRARWERELLSTTGEHQELAWMLLEVYPTALEGTDRERELERVAKLADTIAKAPNAPPIWQDRAAFVRARMMAPRCDPADVRAGIKFLQTAWYDLEDSDFPASELATQLGECRKLLPASDPLVVEAAAKVAWVYWAFGEQSENPVRQQELFGWAIPEATFVFEQRHQLLPKETPPGEVLVALVWSLHQLKRTLEALQWFDLLLADAQFLAAEPEFAEALKLVHFDIVDLLSTMRVIEGISRSARHSCREWSKRCRESAAIGPTRFTSTLGLVMKKLERTAWPTRPGTRSRAAASATSSSSDAQPASHRRPRAFAFTRCASVRCPGRARRAPRSRAQCRGSPLRGRNRADRATTAASRSVFRSPSCAGVGHLRR